jgi:DNA-binding NarL/FixJ family response regulator
VVIADDHELARAGLRSVLAETPGLEIVGEAADGRQAVELCRRLQPDLVLMDVRMPELDGLAATAAVRQACPTTRVIVITLFEQPEYLAQALRAGAVGYVLKGTTRRDVLATVRQVLRGEPALPPDLASQLLMRLTSETAESTPAIGNGSPPPEAARAPAEPARMLPDRLTRREIDVLRLVAQGRTNQEIGRELTLSVSTVKTHVEHIIDKLDVSDRTQAAVRAAELGLIDARR